MGEQNVLVGDLDFDSIEVEGSDHTTGLPFDEAARVILERAKKDGTRVSVLDKSMGGGGCIYEVMKVVSLGLSGASFDQFGTSITIEIEHIHYIEF